MVRITPRELLRHKHEIQPEMEFVEFNEEMTDVIYLIRFRDQIGTLNIHMEKEDPTLAHLSFSYGNTISSHKDTNLLKVCRYIIQICPPKN